MDSETDAIAAEKAAAYEPTSREKYGDIDEFSCPKINRFSPQGKRTSIKRRVQRVLKISASIVSLQREHAPGRIRPKKKSLVSFLFVQDVKVGSS